MKNIALNTAALLAAILSAQTLLAQSGGSYDLSWSAIDGGGGASTGGVFAVSGTIGQPDAGASSGGSYAVAGGFWGVIAAMQTPGAPLLSITRANTSLVISWPLPAPGFVLDETPALIGSPPPWTQVAFPYQTNATDIFMTVAAPTGNKFYRLRKP